MPDEEEKDFVFESGGPKKNDLLGTICEVVMSEMYENSSVGDIESHEGSFSSSGGSSGSSIMNTLNHKLKIATHQRDSPKIETKLHIPRATVP